MATATKAAKKENGRLPGMEDPEIDELIDAANAYVKIRDRRMALTPQEADLKQDVLRIMKKHGKKTYNHDGIEITVIAEEETVKVKIKKDEADE